MLRLRTLDIQILIVPQPSIGAVRGVMADKQLPNPAYEL